MVETNESKKAEALWQTLVFHSSHTTSISVLASQTLFSAPTYQSLVAWIGQRFK